MPRHKSSIGKQFTDEVLSPVKQPPLKLGPDSPETSKSLHTLTANKRVESLTTLDNKKRYAANNQMNGGQYANLSSLSINDGKQSRQFHTVGANSPIRSNEPGQAAYENYLGGATPGNRPQPMNRNASRGGINGGSMSAL